MRRTWTPSLAAMTVATAVAVVVVAASGFAAHAADPRCSQPPYGGSPDRYRAIVETHKDLASVAKLLEDICNMKFGGADRAELHKLGFSDQDIDGSDTSTLAVDVLTKVKGR